MEKTLFSFFLAMLLISCGGGQTSTTPEESSVSSESSSSVQSSAESKSDGDVLKRVEQIYNDVFSNYYQSEEEEGDESLATNTPDEKYCSQEWNELLGKVVDYDTTHHPDDIGFFEADYWIMAQDYDNPKATNFKLVEQKGNRAVVDFEIHNFEVKHARVEMVNERGNWFIDNFIEPDYDLDWKADMKDYLK